MSTRTSNAHDDAAFIRRAVQAEVGRAPLGHDPSMKLLREARIGEPALVRSPAGDPAFWLVPFLLGNQACGFARVELTGRVAQVGRFGAAAGDRSSWPQADFFDRPPGHLLDEVRTKHPALPFGEPTLSYDGSPARWAWRIAVGEPAVTVAYLTPGGWYSRPASTAPPQDRVGQQA
jgi:hypothetical protein